MSQFTAEIQELPEALKRMVNFYKNEGRERLRVWTKKVKSAQNRLLFSGMGTSEFTPLAIRAKLASAGVAADIIDAGEWLHYGMADVHEHARLVVLLSQSGESGEIVRLLKKDLIPPGSVAITNNEKSPLAHRAELVLPLQAGKEASISTKTYTNTLGLLYLLAAALEGDSAIERAFAAIERAADTLLAIDEFQIVAAVEMLTSGKNLAFVGRGPAYAAARQCALTFMEGAKGLAAAFTGGAFRHGPFESLDADFRLVLFAPQGQTTAMMEKLGREAAKLGVQVVCLTDADLQSEKKFLVLPIKHFDEDASEDLFPLLASGTHPRLLYHFAKARGFEPGEFRYCKKVTTAE